MILKTHTNNRGYMVETCDESESYDQQMRDRGLYRVYRWQAPNLLFSYEPYQAHENNRAALEMARAHKAKSLLGGF